MKAKTAKLLVGLMLATSLLLLAYTMVSVYGTATIWTDKPGYSSGETVSIYGSGFTPNVYYDIPVIRPDGSIVHGDGSSTLGWDKVQASAYGRFIYYYKLDGIEGLYEVRVYNSPWSGSLDQTPLAATTFIDPPPKCNLDQIRNGAYDDPWDPAEWVNGNAGAKNAHYVEGYSIGYRLRMTDLPLQSITLIMGYDIRHSSRNAIDYLTSYNRINSPYLHQDVFGHPAETIDPLIDTGISPGPPSSTFPIPTPAGAIPAASFGALPPAERVMSLWGGTITAMAYVTQGSLTDAISETTVSITFTATSPTAVLAWGGHIASRADWGFAPDGTPNSAGGISGSPYHMFKRDWTLGNIGEEDRSLAAVAVYVPPGTIVVIKNTIGGDGTFTFTGTGGDGLPASFSITTSGGTGSVTYTGIDTTLTYGVTETVPAGWKLVGYSVSTGEPNTAFHVASGTTTTITVTDKKLGTIVVVKNTVGGDGTFSFTGTGGSTLPGSFSLTTVSGTASVTYSNVDPDNTYGVVETVPGGWKLVGYVVSTAEPNTAFHVAAGGTTTVTVTDKKLGTIIVVKNTVGGNGAFDFVGTGTPSIDGFSAAFTITTAAGTGSQTFSNIDPDNTYGVTETLPSGWKFVSVSVSTGEPNTAFTVAPGGTTTVTFTDKKLGTIVVVKNTIGGDGTFPMVGSGAGGLPASISVTTSGGTGSVTYNNIDPDLTYSVVESSVPAGWKLVGYVVSTGQPNTAFTVAPGGTTTVTVTDKKLGTIIVVKNTIGGDGTFSFTGTGGSTLPASFSITTSGLTGSQTYNNVDPDNTYGVTETVPAGWKLVGYVVSTGEPNTAFHVAAGGTTTITVTDKKLGTIIVVKNTLGGDGTFTFAGTGGSTLPVSFSITTSGLTGSQTYTNVDPDNTYGVVETVPAGWKLVGYVVSTAEPNTAFHVAAGGTTTVTVTDKKLGTIIIVKNTIGGNGPFDFVGTGTPSIDGFSAAFTITTSGGTGSQTFNNIDPDNTYGVTETVPAGWNLVSTVVSTGEPNTAFHVAPGGTTTVTFTDTKLSTIVVVKNTIGGDGTFSYTGTGGSTLPGSFSITTSGLTGSQTYTDVDPSLTYGVTETVPAGWKFVSVTVSTGQPNTAFTVAPGGVTTVTFTDKKLGTIIVVKNTIGGDGTFDFTGTGGSTLPASFSLTTVSGTKTVTYSNVDPDNTYGVVETVPLGWKLVGYVVSTAEPNTAFHVAAGGTTTVTVTDKKLGTIIVVKNTIGGDGTFSFTGTGGSTLPGSFSITTSGLTGSQTYTDVDPDLTYGVTETVPAGWKLVGYVVSTAEPNTAFHVAAGGTTTVTVTDKKLGTIIVVKNTIGGDGTFSFTGTGGSTLPASFSITTSGLTGSVTYNNVDPDNTYGVVETVPAGWDLVGYVVSTAEPNTAFHVAAGGTTTVTVTDKVKVKFLKEFTDSGALNGFTKPVIIDPLHLQVFELGSGPRIWWEVTYTVENKEGVGHYFIMWDKWGGNLMVLNATPTAFNFALNQLTLSNGKSFIIDYAGYSWYIGIAGTDISGLATKGKAWMTLHTGDQQQGTNPGKGYGTSKDGKSYDVDIRWEIGWLGPGESATLKIIVAPGKNPGGKLLFSSCGCYVINTGPRVRVYSGPTYANNEFLFAVENTNQLTVCVIVDPPKVIASVSVFGIIAALALFVFRPLYQRKYKRSRRFHSLSRTREK